ncbi:PRY3 [Scenedesmus sp. PABB004]|nr:PRY3 [Scenedesmus sp. PABB004]
MMLRPAAARPAARRGSAAAARAPALRPAAVRPAARCGSAAAARAPAPRAVFRAALLRPQQTQAQQQSGSRTNWAAAARRAAASAAAAVLLTASAHGAAALEVKLGADPVFDGAAVLRPDARDALAARLRALEAARGWHVRVYTSYALDARSDGPTSPRGLWGSLDADTVVLLVDPSAPNVLNPGFIGDRVLRVLRRPFWSELSSRYGNLFFVRDEGAAAALLGAAGAIADCLERPDGCAVVPGLPPEQYTATLVCATAAGLLAGSVARIKPSGRVQRQWVWLLLFSPLWAPVFINFGLAPVLVRTDDVAPLAANTAAFLAAAAAPTLLQRAWDGDGGGGGDGEPDSAQRTRDSDAGGEMRELAGLLLLALLAQPGAAKLSVRGNQLLDNGQPIKFLHGINWFGFNNAQTMVDGLWAGQTSLTKDFSTQVYRQMLLGFNAVRLPFSFRDFALPGRTDYNWCTPASEDDIRRSVTPPGVDPYARALPKPRAPLTVRDGRCNVGMPSDVFDRFVWAINTYTAWGFKVVIDNHVWLEDPTAYEDPKAWVDGWVRLARAISQSPSAGNVMYDLVNEPDNKKIFWRARFGRPSLFGLYQSAMEAVYKVQPDAVFVLEGTGQIGYAIPSGDGFVTDPGVIRSFSGARARTTRYELQGIEDPNFFFQWLLSRPFAQNVVWGPHFYAQSVIPFALPKQHMEPPGLYKRMSDSFGYLTTKGYCAAGKCLKWPVLLGEFSAPHAGAPGDYATMRGLVSYVKNEGTANDGRHTAITNWFYWCWNDNSPDTNGGIVKADWASVDWDKVNWLRQIGLTPCRWKSHPPLQAFAPSTAARPERAAMSATRPCAMLVLGLALASAAGAAARVLTEEPPAGGLSLSGPVPSFAPGDVAALPGVEPAALPAAMDPLYAEIVQMHNDFRALHGAPALVWDDYLASEAEAWAKQCKWEHYVDGYGQNLAASAPAGDPAGAMRTGIKGWYGEIKLYSWDNPGFSMAAGHFTQVVWFSSAKIGCFVQRCENFPAFQAGWSAEFTVCNYSPPGNINSAEFFRNNVRPLLTNPPPSSTPPPAEAPPAAAPKPSAALQSDMDEKLTSGTVAANSCLNSANRGWRLCIQKTGELVVSKRVGTRWVVNWRLGRRGSTLNNQVYQLKVGQDGKVVVVNAVTQEVLSAIASAGGSSDGPFQFVMENTGALTFYDGSLLRVCRRRRLRLLRARAPLPESSMNDLQDLVAFVGAAKPEVRAAALDIVAGLSASPEGLAQLRAVVVPLTGALLRVVPGGDAGASRLALSALVNMSRDPGLAAALLQFNAVGRIMEFVRDKSCAHIELLLMLLVNLTVADKGAEDLLQLGAAGMQGLHMALLLKLFVTSAVTLLPGEPDPCEHIGSLLVNATRLAPGRQLLLQPGRGFLQALAAQLGPGSSLARRRGCSGALRNCCISAEADGTLAELVSDELVLQRIMAPLGGGGGGGGGGGAAAPVAANGGAAAPAANGSAGAAAPAASGSGRDPDVTVREALAEAVAVLAATDAGRKALWKVSAPEVLRQAYEDEDAPSVCSAMEHAARCFVFDCDAAGLEVADDDGGAALGGGGGGAAAAALADAAD